MAVHMGNVDQALATAKKVQEYITAGFDTCIDVAMDLAEYDRDSGENSSKTLKELRDTMKEYCEMEKMMNDAIQAAELVKDEVRQGEIQEDFVMTKMFEAKLAELSKVPVELEKHHRIEEFDQRIEEAGASEGEGVGTVVTEEFEDDGMAMVAEVNTRCPYTGKEMVHPVTNKHCKHNYDREGILQFIKSRGIRAKCPVGGCANTVPLHASDLEDNLELKKVIDRKNRQQGKKGKR